VNPVIFRIHQSVTKIRLSDSAIQKSTSCFRNTPLFEKKNTNHFRIDESVAKSWIPISDNLKNSSFFKLKVKVSFGIYKIVGVQEAKHRGAGRRSPLKEELAHDPARFH